MRFYHAFPRVPRTSQLEDADRRSLGERILGSILRHGLLLAPEPLHIPPNPASDLASPPSTTIIQRRASFTLLEPEELHAPHPHAEMFGRFAIGVGTMTARELGMVPTLYYYRSADADRRRGPEDSGISQEILYRLSEVRRLLIALAHLEACAFPASRLHRSVEQLRIFGLVLDDEVNIKAELDALQQSEARRVSRLLNTDRVPAWNLAEWIEIILSMFQTADSGERRRHLAYYAQREWRIVQFLAEGTKCFPLREEYWPFLVSSPAGSWTVLANARREIEQAMRGRKSSFDLDECYLLMGAGGRPFREFISELVVPVECGNSARSLLQEVGLSSRFSASQQRDSLVFEYLEG